MAIRANAILRRSVRDHTRGAMHSAGETIQVCGTVKRASFDTTELLRVKFCDGSEALLFEDELAQEVRADDLSKPWRAS
jgi:hypothetical protein